MIKRLVKHGNSSALILEKGILDLLNVDNDTPLEVRTDGKNIIISPRQDMEAENDVLSALESVNKKHGNVLRKLGQ